MGTRILTATGAAILCLAACGQAPEESPGERAANGATPVDAAAGVQVAPPLARSAAPAPPKPPEPAALVLTPDGMGRLKIGMRRAEAARYLIAADEDASEACEIYQVAQDPDSWAMFLDGKLSRISLEGGSRARTEAGFGLGAKEADIIAAYGDAVEIEPHAYDGPEAHYLTLWTKAKTRGLRFETDAEGIVRVIHGGDESIQLVESCS